MALAYQVESLDGLDEGVQSLYTEKDGKYVLAVDGLPEQEDVSGLKANRDQVLKEAKDLKNKLSQLEKEKQERDEKSAKEKGEFKELFEQRDKELADLRAEVEQRDQKLKAKDIKSAADAIGHGLAKSDAKRAEVLSDYAAKYAEYSDGEVVYKIGGVEVDAEAVQAHLVEEYPFLVDGSGAAGGGAGGGKGGGAAGSKKASEMTSSEKSKFIGENGLSAWQTKVESNS